MAHVRKQIRDAVVTAVTGLVTTGSNVYKARDLPLHDADLPCLCVYGSTDTPSYEDSIMQNSIYRTIDIRIIGYTKGVSLDTLDTIAEEVETAFYADYTFGGLAINAELGEQEISFEDETEKLIGIIEMSFLVTYRVAEGAPGTAI